MAAALRELLYCLRKDTSAERVLSCLKQVTECAPFLSVDAALIVTAVTECLRWEFDQSVSAFCKYISDRENTKCRLLFELFTDEVLCNLLASRRCHVLERSFMKRLMNIQHTEHVVSDVWRNAIMIHKHLVPCLIQEMMILTCPERFSVNLDLIASVATEVGASLGTITILYDLGAEVKSVASALCDLCAADISDFLATSESCSCCLQTLCTATMIHLSHELKKTDISAKVLTVLKAIPSCVDIYNSVLVSNLVDCLPLSTDILDCMFTRPGLHQTKHIAQTIFAKKLLNNKHLAKDEKIVAILMRCGVFHSTACFKNLPISIKSEKIQLSDEQRSSIVQRMKLLKREKKKTKKPL